MTQALHKKSDLISLPHFLAAKTVTLTGMITRDFYVEAAKSLIQILSLSVARKSV